MWLNFTKCLFLLLLFKELKAEYYSSVAGLEKLINMEEKLITVIEDYMGNVQKVQSTIESFLDDLEIKHKTIQNGDENYYNKPTNAFSIIKRLVMDWKHYDELIEMHTEINNFNVTVTQLETNYTKPSINDLEGAARGLSRLQSTYQLDTQKVANGYLLDYKYGEALTAHDCFIMGTSLYNSKQYLKASEWFLQASKLIDETEIEDVESFMSSNFFISKVDILQYLQVALYYGGNYKLAKIINEQLLTLDPENNMGLTSKSLYERAAIEERRLRNVSNRTEVHISGNC